MVIIRTEKKPEPVKNNQDQMKSMVDNTINSINALSHEIINLEEIVFRNLEE